MKEVVIDTTVYIDIFRGVSSVKERLEGVNKIYVSPIVIGEVWQGIRTMKEEFRSKEKAFLEDFCVSPGVEVISIVAKTAEHYAVIVDWLRKQGTPLPVNDVWIAASACEHGLALATNDQHFKKIPHVILV